MVPDVTTVARQVSTVDGLGNSLSIADGTSSSVDEPSARLERADVVLVDQVDGLLVQWAVDGNHITLAQKVLEVVDSAHAHLLGSFSRQLGVVIIEKLLGGKGNHSLQDSVSNTSGANGTDDLVLQVKGVSRNLRDLPVAADSLGVTDIVVAHQNQNRHYDVLGDGDYIGARNLGDGDLVLVGGVEVDVVRSDTGSDTELEVLGAVQELLGSVSRVEGRGDQNLGVLDVLLELRVGALLVRGDDELVTFTLGPIADANGILGGTEETGLFLSGLASVVENCEDLRGVEDVKRMSVGAPTNTGDEHPIPRADDSIHPYNKLVLALPLNHSPCPCWRW